jgi:hypothetical protein
VTADGCVQDKSLLRKVAVLLTSVGATRDAISANILQDDMVVVYEETAHNAASKLYMLFGVILCRYDNHHKVPQLIYFTETWSRSGRIGTGKVFALATD